LFSLLTTFTKPLPKEQGTHPISYEDHEMHNLICRGVMLPLMNLDILATLIVGFVQEYLDLLALAERYKRLVNEEHDNGANQERLEYGLWKLLRKEHTKVITLVSTPVYDEPPKADDDVATWLNAPNTPSVEGKLSVVISCYDCINCISSFLILASKSKESSRQIYRASCPTG
jgi:hypothetical protein